MFILKDGEKILFTGDSITDAGRGRPVGEGLWDGVGSGFVRCFDNFLNVFYPEYIFHVMNTGCGGATSRDMINTWEENVLALKPDKLILCIGVNDVWRQFDSPGCTNQHVYPEEFEANMRKAIESAKANIPYTLLMTPYFMEPNDNDPMRIRMDEYGNIVKRLAEEYSLPCIDLQKVFCDYLKYRHSTYLMWDRVHPGQVGSMIIANQLLKEFGFDKAVGK